MPDLLQTRLTLLFLWVLVLPVQADNISSSGKRMLVCIEEDGDQKAYQLALTGTEGENFDNPYMTSEEVYTDTEIFVYRRFYGPDGQRLLDSTGEAVASMFVINRYTGRFVFTGMGDVRTKGSCEKDRAALF